MEVKEIHRRKEKREETRTLMFIRPSIGGYDLHFTEEESEAQKDEDTIGPG